MDRIDEFEDTTVNFITMLVNSLITVIRFNAILTLKVTVQTFIYHQTLLVESAIDDAFYKREKAR